MPQDESNIINDTVDSEIFARILFSPKALRLISDVKNSGLRHDLPISINDRVILPFCEGSIFTKLRIHMRSFAKIKSSLKFLNLQY